MLCKHGCSLSSVPCCGGVTLPAPPDSALRGSGFYSHRLSQCGWVGERRNWFIVSLTIISTLAKRRWERNVTNSIALKVPCQLNAVTTLSKNNRVRSSEETWKRKGALWRSAAHVSLTPETQLCQAAGRCCDVMCCACVRQKKNLTVMREAADTVSKPDTHSQDKWLFRARTW